jgi:2-amino-4-hydroxy-6-hydroxymethyldihydropteridine diphosphokinase
MENKHTLWLSLGSNLGDRQGSLLKGIEVLLECGLEFVDCSGIYETDPVGLVEQPQFLNMVIKLRTSLDPLEVLACCQEAEARLNRQRSLRWGPRTLDVDILLFDKLSLQLPQLEVPHPRMAERAFVLGPLAEMDPEVLVAWGLLPLTEGIRLQVTADDVKMLLQHRDRLD